MSDTTGIQCDDATMQQALAVAAEDSQAGIGAIEQLLADYPDDARLHFLKGSLLIGIKRFIGAHQSLQRALEIAPGFDLARFQLGFFELTSGEGASAIRTWLPLKTLPATHYLHRFSEGLEHLISDRFEQCIACLREGIAVNAENPPLNNDMQLIIDKCSHLLSEHPADHATAENTEVSATSLLLGASRFGTSGRGN